MTEYIKREDAIQAAKHAWAKGLEPSQYIEIVSAADAAEVKHGRWEFPVLTDVRDALDPRVKCSVCGSIETALARWSYCPHCGARMAEVTPDAR